MNETRTVTQKRFGVMLRYQFEPDKIECIIRDPSGERRFSVNYEAINILSPSTVVSNNRIFFQRTMIIPVSLALAAFVASNINRIFSQWLEYLAGTLIFGLFAAQHMKVFAVNYTMLQLAPPPPGSGNQPLRIIRDKDHDALFNEITARWRTRMKVLHGTPNLANDAAREIAKFDWLKEKFVITDKEYQEAIRVVQAAAAVGGVEPARHGVN